MRIDKYLWAVRLFKTRSEAKKACDNGKVFIGDECIKASKTIAPKVSFSIKTGAVKRSYSVLELPKSRVGAKLVADYMLETTSDEDLQFIKELNKLNRENHIQGIKGRPTKKDRRDMMKYRGK